MIDTMNNGGKIAILGIAPEGFGIDWNKSSSRMLTLKGIYGRENVRDVVQDDCFVEGGLDLSPIITLRIASTTSVTALTPCGREIPARSSWTGPEKAGKTTGGGGLAEPSCRNRAREPCTAGVRS